jgi:hypothetical protein
MLTAGPAITWVKVEKPSFDLVGLVLGSFKLAGVLLIVACALGVLSGILIRSRRRPLPPPMDEVSLHLGHD